jgi:2-polyprenyl-6-methoxyphenol hydroxylase-like FAD-dependent oxidoreductase
MIETPIVIVGGGPSGLMLANELGIRGVPALLVDAKPSTAFNPQANATQARTMEYFRRLGFASEIRKLGLPPDHPTDIAYLTRLSTYELARLSLPTSAQSALKVRSMGGSWSAAELPHRISQKYVEPVLKKHAEKWKTNDIRFAWKLNRYERFTDHIKVWIQPIDNSTEELEVRTQYLIGADGARSQIRQSLGISYVGDTGVKRGFMGGQMFAVYFKSETLYDKIPHPRCWMYVTVNAQRRSLLLSVNGANEFAFHAAIHEGESADDWTKDDAYSVLTQAIGCEIDAEILSFLTWTAGHSLYTEKMSDDRVFIMGDAAHLFTPTGGLGYNTAVEDAVNLGWKLASVVKGNSPKELLETYTIERSPIAKRNTTYAKRFADSVGLFEVSDDFEMDNAKGVSDRLRASEYFNAHVRLEFNIPGVTFGSRYDRSPIISGESGALPPDEPNTYNPFAGPGGRPPHFWINDELSLFDTFGQDWTLLCTGQDIQPHKNFIEAASRRGINLKVIHHTQIEILNLYEASLILIRPDQIVAWRGNNDDHAIDIIDQVLGWKLSK